MDENREITGVHDISGTIYREVAPTFKRVTGTDIKVDGSGIRRIWHRGPRKTELLTWESEEQAIVRQELTFQNLLIETNQTGIVRTGHIPQDGAGAEPHAVQFTASPDASILKKCAMLLADMRERDAYQHHLLETLNATLESVGHAPLNVMHRGPHNYDRHYHDTIGHPAVIKSANQEHFEPSSSAAKGYWLRLAVGFVAATLLLILLAR